jgi:RecA/RadA recombinase
MPRCHWRKEAGARRGERGKSERGRREKRSRAHTRELTHLAHSSGVIAPSIPQQLRKGGFIEVQPIVYASRVNHIGLQPKG